MFCRWTRSGRNRHNYLFLLQHVHQAPPCLVKSPTLTSSRAPLLQCSRRSMLSCLSTSPRNCRRVSPAPRLPRDTTCAERWKLWNGKLTHRMKFRNGVNEAATPGWRVRWQRLDWTVWRSGVGRVGKSGKLQKRNTTQLSMNDRGSLEWRSASGVDSTSTTTAGESRSILLSRKGQRRRPDEWRTGRSGCVRLPCRCAMHLVFSIIRDRTCFNKYYCTHEGLTFAQRRESQLALPRRRLISYVSTSP